jgi:hypothetical protein
VKVAERHQRGKAGRPANSKRRNRTITVNQPHQTIDHIFPPRRKQKKKKNRENIIGFMARRPAQRHHRGFIPQQLHNAFPSRIRYVSLER